MAISILEGLRKIFSVRITLIVALILVIALSLIACDKETGGSKIPKPPIEPPPEEPEPEPEPEPVPEDLEVRVWKLKNPLFNPDLPENWEEIEGLVFFGNTVVIQDITLRSAAKLEGDYFSIPLRLEMVKGGVVLGAKEAVIQVRDTCILGLRVVHNLPKPKTDGFQLLEDAFVRSWHEGKIWEEEVPAEESYSIVYLVVNVTNGVSPIFGDSPPESFFNFLDTEPTSVRLKELKITQSMEYSTDLSEVDPLEFEDPTPGDFKTVVLNFGSETIQVPRVLNHQQIYSLRCPTIKYCRFDYEVDANVVGVEEFHLTQDKMVRLLRDRDFSALGDTSYSASAQLTDGYFQNDLQQEGYHLFLYKITLENGEIFWWSILARMVCVGPSPPPPEKCKAYITGKKFQVRDEGNIELTNGWTYTLKRGSQFVGKYPMGKTVEVELKEGEVVDFTLTEGFPLGEEDDWIPVGDTTKTAEVRCGDNKVVDFYNKKKIPPPPDCEVQVGTISPSGGLVIEGQVIHLIASATGHTKTQWDLISGNAQLTNKNEFSADLIVGDNPNGATIKVRFRAVDENYPGECYDETFANFTMKNCEVQVGAIAPSGGEVTEDQTVHLTISASGYTKTEWQVINGNATLTNKTNSSVDLTVGSNPSDTIITVRFLAIDENYPGECYDETFANFTMKCKCKSYHITVCVIRVGPASIKEIKEIKLTFGLTEQAECITFSKIKATAKMFCDNTCDPPGDYEVPGSNWTWGLYNDKAQLIAQGNSKEALFNVQDGKHYTIVFRATTPDGSVVSQSADVFVPVP